MVQQGLESYNYKFKLRTIILILKKYLQFGGLYYKDSDHLEFSYIVYIRKKDKYIQADKNMINQSERTREE